jgi:hypothetical protein
MAPALILIRQNTNRTRLIAACKRSFNLSWRYQKASKRLNMLKPMRLTLTRKTLMYKSLGRSCLEYADIVRDGCNETRREHLVKGCLMK